jgi:gliding motility-associated-like protein
MNKSLLMILLTAFSVAKSQNTLPYSGNQICLDQIIPVSSASVPVARSLVVKDFDLDGFQDVLVANISTGALEIYKSNGNGTFAMNVAVSSVFLNKTNSFAAGFFNNDSRPDIAVSVANTIQIYENLGGLTFSLVSTIAVSGYSDNPSQLRAADMNMDNLDDIIIALARPGFGGLGMLVYRNSFVAPSAYTFSLDYSKQVFITAPPLTTAPGSTVNMDFAIGDFDGDVKVDIAATYTEKKDSVYFFKNLSGAGTSLTFAPIAARSPTILQSYSVTCRNCEMGDMDKDGFEDLVLITSAFNGTVTINGFAMVRGGSIFSTTPSLYQSVPTDFIGNNIPNDFELSDLNNDNHKDFIGIRDNKLWIYFWDTIPVTGYPVGRFKDAAPVVIDMPPFSVADVISVGDFDNNSKKDIFYKPWRLGSGKINVIPNFSYPLKISTNNSAICSGGSATLSAFSYSTGVTPTYDWFVKTNTVSLGSGATFTINQPGTYSASLSFPFPYGGGFCNIYKSDTLLILSKPGPTVAITGTSNVCPGASATLIATGSGSAGYSYLWVGPGTNSLAATATATTAPVFGADIYNVYITDLASSCTGSGVTGVSVFPPGPENIIASKLLVCLGDSSRLSMSGALSFSWSTGSTDSVLYVKPVTGTDYTLYYKDLNGCPYTRMARVGIDLNCEIKIYNTVTKNGDNLNDIWTIDNINRYPDNKVTIFNRWGTKVFETRGYDNINKFWPAKEFDSAAPSTYYYVIDLGTGTKAIKGWIELIKN